LARERLIKKVQNNMKLNKNVNRILTSPISAFRTPGQSPLRKERRDKMRTSNECATPDSGSD